MTADMAVPGGGPFKGTPSAQPVVIPDAMKAYYPVFLDLARRKCVIVGGGTTALNKARTLAAYGADVVVITPSFTPALSELHHSETVTVELREYVRGDLDGAFLVVSATGTDEVDEAVYSEAAGRGCLINVIRRPELSNYIVPSTVNRGELQIAVSTGGAAPVIAKRLKKRFQEEFGEHWSDYVSLLGLVRDLAARNMRGVEKRKALLEKIVDSDLLERMSAGERPTAQKVYEEFTKPPEDPAAKKSKR